MTTVGLSTLILNLKAAYITAHLRKWILNPDPTCFAMYIYGPAEIQEGFRYISLSQHFYCTVDGISFGDSAEIDSLSCFFQENRMLFGIQN